MGLSRLNVETERGSTVAIGRVGEALKKVNEIRSMYGAYQNRLEHAYSVNRNTSENTQSAESIIRDTDMATEMVKYSNANILLQAGQAMLAQANQSKDVILTLIG
jgi:flagellin-like hook-associated protein FlgL